MSSTYDINLTQSKAMLVGDDVKSSVQYQGAELSLYGVTTVSGIATSLHKDKDDNWTLVSSTGNVMAKLKAIKKASAEDKAIYKSMAQNYFKSTQKAPSGESVQLSAKVEAPPENWGKKTVTVSPPGGYLMPDGPHKADITKEILKHLDSSPLVKKPKILTGDDGEGTLLASKPFIKMKPGVPVKVALEPFSLDDHMMVFKPPMEKVGNEKEPWQKFFIKMVQNYQSMTYDVVVGYAGNGIIHGKKYGFSVAYDVAEDPKGTGKLLGEMGQKPAVKAIYDAIESDGKDPQHLQHWQDKILHILMFKKKTK